MTPGRNVRVPDGVWEAAKMRAAAEGTSVSAVVVETLTEYAAGVKR